LVNPILLHFYLLTIVSEFQVSDGFIADITVTPDSHSAEGNLYLVEPLRTSTRVRKFTGTMAQAKPTDKAGVTIAAFTHWVIQDTACKLCFADVQGI
jgi:Alpha-kinase family